MEYVAREDAAASAARTFKEAACKDVLEKNQTDRKIEKQQQLLPGAEWYKQDQYGFQHLNCAWDIESFVAQHKFLPEPRKINHKLQYSSHMHFERAR